MPARFAPPPFALADGLSREYLLHHRVCPRGFAEDGATLVLATAPDALLDDAVDDVALAYGLPVRVEPASVAEIERLIERLTTLAERPIELSRADGTGDDGDALDAD